MRTLRQPRSPAPAGRPESPAGSRPCPGFTLIELLVVVAIIALLMTILIPTLLTVREKTRLIMCQSNLRTVAFGWHAYLRDNKDRLPRGYLIGTTFGGKQGRAEGYVGPRPLNRYLNLPPILPENHGANVFLCPGDTGSWIPANPESIYSTHYDWYGTSYRTNRFVIGPVPPQTSWYDPCYALIKDLRERFDTLSLNVSNFANDTRLVLVGDYGFCDWQNPAYNEVPLEFHARAYRSGSRVSYDPLGASRQNLAFLDGHAAFVDVRKGIHVSSGYTVIPFRDMQQAFADDQKPGHFP